MKYLTMLLAVMLMLLTMSVLGHLVETAIQPLVMNPNYEVNQ